MSSRRAVLLDRDGTIIVEKNYLASASGVELLPGAVDGLRMLREAGFLLIVITNQSGIGRGKFTVADMAEVNDEIQRQLGEHGLELDGFYYCPHAPDQACDCRKPMPLLARQAASDFGFDLGQAFVIGDKRSDVELGTATGARSVLVRTGYGREWEAAGTQADAIVDDLAAAALFVLTIAAV